MKRIIFYLLVISGIVTCSLLANSVESKSPCGIYMKVSGRIIEKETGKGIKGVAITINNKIDNNDLTAYSDQDGNYEIKMVPPGIYEILVVPIHRTCPYPLVVEKVPEDFTVKVGRNIKRLNLYLIKGGSISGRVFGPDGVTPFCDGRIKVVNALLGKIVELNLKDEGKFKFDGLSYYKENESPFIILVKPNGYAFVGKSFRIKPGEEIKDFNFIVGLGDIEVKGNVLSSVDDLPIKGAEIHITSLDRHIERTSDAIIMTDESGNYSILGFKNLGTVRITIFHDEFEMTRVLKDLKRSINTFDFKLNPKKDKKKISDFLKEIRAPTASGSASFEGCLCPESTFNTYIDLSCNRLSNDEKKRCIKFKDTLDCMNERCKDRKMIKIKCDKNCPPDPLNGAVPCGVAKAMNVDIKSPSEFTICFNGNTGCSPLVELVTIFHELFHTCDRESQPNSKRGDPCSEARAHGAAACVWEDEWSEKQFEIYNKECPTVTPN